MHEPRRLVWVLDQPEFNVVFFGFLLNLPWELLQVPFFRGMMTALHWPAVKECTAAAAGDAMILLVAFWLVAAGSRSRSWMMQLTGPRVLAFVAAGLVATIGFERHATAVGRWEYADAMPIVPWLEVGLVPLVQWFALPVLLVWIIRRQLRRTD